MILRHGAAYLATSVASAALGLTATLVLTRLLGPEAFGVYGLGQSVSTFVLYAGFEWLTWVVAPLIAARAGADRAIAAALGRMFLWTAAAVAVLGLGALPFIAPAMRWPLLAACASALALGYFQLTAQFAVVRLTPARYAAMNLARSAGTFGALVGAALLGAPVAVLLAAPAIGALLGLAARGRHGVPDADGAADADAPRRAALRLGAPLAGVFAIYAVQLSADRWIIEAMSGTSQLGQYVAASMTVQVPIVLLASSIGMAALPLALRAAQQSGRPMLDAQLRSNFALLAGLVTPAAVGLAFVAPRLVPVLVGDSFVAGTILLAPWLCAAAWAGAMRANYLDHAFYIAARTRPQVAVMAVLASVQVFGTVALLPVLGLRGAAAAEIAGNIAAGAVSAWLGRSVCAIPAPWRDMRTIAASCAAMLVALELVRLPSSLAGAIGQIAVGASVYLVSIVCFDLAGIRRFLLARLPRPRRAGLHAALAGAFVLATLGACASTPPGAVAPMLSPPAPTRQEYLLQPGDEVEIRFFDVPQLDDRVGVRPDGRITLQLAGQVDAAGRTVDQLRDAIEAKYKGILKNPQLSVALRTSATQKVYVDGEVTKPGLVESPEPLTMAAAVAAAGGLKETADASDVLLIRRGHEGRQQVSVLNLHSVQNGTDLSQNVQLATNDFLFVPRSAIGEVNKLVDLYLRQNIPVYFGYTIP